MPESAGSGVNEKLVSLIPILPKVELHLHLEGSIRAERFLKLSRKYKTDFRRHSVTEIQDQLFSYPDFSSFLATFKVVCQHLREAEDYVSLVTDLRSYLQSQNIRYAELMVTPAIPAKFGFKTREILKAVLAAGKVVADELSIELRWIFDCVRQFGPEPARETAELAAEFRGQGVVGLGLGGDETAVQSREFEETFGWARAQGLHAHVHAGETGGPQSVWEAVKILGADRIGHGIQAARDQELMSHLKNHAIGLDICLTSNARTRVCAPVSTNPFRLLYKRGVPVTLNTDDPGLFDTKLEQEYAAAIRCFGLGKSDLSRIILQGVRSSFLSRQERTKLVQEFQDALRVLTDR